MSANVVDNGLNKAFTGGLAAQTTRLNDCQHWQIVPLWDRVRRGGAAWESVLLAVPRVSSGSVSGRAVDNLTDQPMGWVVRRAERSRKWSGSAPPRV
jgi:hypothetical protein